LLKKRASGRLKTTGSEHGVAKAGPQRGRIERAIKKTSNRRKSSDAHSRFFNSFKKEVKKLNLKKGADLKIFKKWPARSTGGRRGAGHLPPIQRAGGAKSFSKSLSRIKFFSYSRRGPSRGGKGILPAQRAGGALFLFFLNLYFTNYLKFILFSNTRFIRHTLLYAYKILVQFYEKDYGI
jgi:hypothetical protein